MYISHLFSDKLVIQVVFAACLAAVGLACASIRYFHMCRPYGKESERYYRARILFCQGFLGYPILLSPYIMCIDSPSAVFFAQSFFILYATSLLPVTLMAYFSEIGFKGFFSNLSRFFSALSILTLVVFDVFLVFDVEIKRWWLYVVAFFASGNSISILAVNWRLEKRLREFDSDNYSSDDDFPHTQARKVIWLPLPVLILSWVVFIVGNHFLASVAFFIAAFVCVPVLILFLHPNSTIHPAAEEETDNEGFSLVTQEKLIDVQKQILALLRDEKLYLNPHLSLDVIYPKLNCGRTYASRACKALGGFYKVVNTMRLEHAEAYSKEHPKASLDEVAEESGFTCRQTMNHAKTRLAKK